MVVERALIRINWAVILLNGGVEEPDKNQLFLDCGDRWYKQTDRQIDIHTFRGTDKKSCFWMLEIGVGGLRYQLLEALIKISCF